LFASITYEVKCAEAPAYKGERATIFVYNSAAAFPAAHNDRTSYVPSKNREDTA
jgi:hypothetical protein